MGFIPYGFISKSHGLKGQVRLVTYSGDFSNLDFIQSVYIKSEDSGDFEKYNIRGQSISGKHAILRLEGVDTVEQADDLKGREVFVDTGELPGAGEDEFYYYELQGLSVFNTADDFIGTVIQINDSGPQELLEVELKDGKEVLIPFVEPVLVEVDIENKKVIVDPPPGLLEL